MSNAVADQNYARPGHTEQGDLHNVCVGPTKLRGQIFGLFFPVFPLGFAGTITK